MDSISHTHGSNLHGHRYAHADAYADSLYMDFRPKAENL